MYHFHKRQNFSSISKLGLISVAMSLGVGTVDTIWALYMMSMIGNVSMVGYLSAAVTVLAVLCNFLLIPMFESKKSTKIFFLSLATYAIIYAIFAVNKNLWLFLIFTVFVTMANEIMYNSFGLLVRKKSDKKKVGASEGFICSLMNMGWLVGPLLSGFVSTYYSVSYSFALGCSFMIISMIMFVLFKIHETHKDVKILDVNLLKNITAFFKQKELLKGYIISTGIFYWWACIYIYMPLYMLKNHMNPLMIGVFLFAVVVPLVLFEFWVGRADDKIKFKLIFIVGLTIPGICGLIAFMPLPIYTVLAILVFASCGLAILEPTRESYFFWLIKRPKQQARFYGPYKTGYYVGNVAGKIIPGAILLFLPFNFVFLSMGLVMLLLGFVALRVKY